MNKIEKIDRMIKSFNLLTDKESEKLKRLENGLVIGDRLLGIDNDTMILMLIQIFKEKLQEIKDNLWYRGVGGMEKNMIIPLEIYYVKNFLEAELVDIQEVEIKEIISTDVVTDKISNMGVNIKETRNLCKLRDLKGYEEEQNIIVGIVSKNGKTFRKYYCLFIEKAGTPARVSPHKI